MLPEGPYERDASPPSPSGLQRELTNEGDVAQISAEEAPMNGGRDAAMRRLVEELQHQLDSTTAERDVAVRQLLELRRQIALLIQPEVPGGPRSYDGDAEPQAVRYEVRPCFGKQDFYGSSMLYQYMGFQICLSKHIWNSGYCILVALAKPNFAPL